MSYLPIIATEMILASAVAIVLYWWASQHLRHKTKKVSFRIRFCGAAAIHIAAVSAFVWLS